MSSQILLDAGLDPNQFLKIKKKFNNFGKKKEKSSTLLFLICFQKILFIILTSQIQISKKVIFNYIFINSKEENVFLLIMLPQFKN